MGSKKNAEDEFEFSERFDVPTQTWAVERVVKGKNGLRALEPWVSVRPSTISGAGDGAFADRGFRKGDLLGHYAGQVAMLDEKHDSDSDYLYEFSIDEIKHPKKLVLDGAKCGNWTRKINDGSVYCNSTFLKDRCNSEFVGHAKIVAAKAIKAGEEILLAYGEEYWKDTHQK